MYDQLHLGPPCLAKSMHDTDHHNWDWENVENQLKYLRFVDFLQYLPPSYTNIHT